jgi:hypothetical protein
MIAPTASWTQRKPLSVRFWTVWETRHFVHDGGTVKVEQQIEKHAQLRFPQITQS